MSEEKKMPTMDDFIKALESRNETKLADQVKQSMIASRLINPLLSVPMSMSKEMQEKLEVYRKPEISQCIVYDTVEDIPNSTTN